MPSLPKVIGHRGAKASAPENTLLSMRAAAAQGCTWIECDVMLTKDKVPVIHHDNTLDRCTDGSGNLWDYTLKEIEQLDAGSHFSADTAGERIPRLVALIECCQDLGLGINLEVKHVTDDCKNTPNANEQEMEEELAHVVCDTIESCHVDPAKLVFSSFSRPAIAVLHRRLPHFNCAFLCEDIPADWESFMKSHNCVSLNFDWRSPTASRELIQECTSKFLCYSYTVNDGEVAHRLISWGVSGVFSDCPAAILATLEQKDYDAPKLVCTGAASVGVVDWFGDEIAKSGSKGSMLIAEINS